MYMCIFGEWQDHDLRRQKKIDLISCIYLKLQGTQQGFEII